MAIVIDSMKIATGEPVTTDLMNTIIKNIQQVAAGPVNVSTINLTNTTDPNSKVSSTVVAVNKKVAVKSSDSGGTKVKFPYSDKKFQATPSVWVQIDTIGLSSPTYAQSVIFPQVISVSATETVVAFRCAVNTTVNATLFAAGEIA
jgi:hypothetical protein